MLHMYVCVAHTGVGSSQGPHTTTQDESAKDAVSGLSCCNSSFV